MPFFKEPFDIDRMCCRGVDIMETDNQGRGLEHYARDSWRMSDREKAEIEAK